MTVLIIAEHTQDHIKPAVLPVVTAASRLLDISGTAGIAVLVAGYQCTGAAREAAQIAGVTQVQIADAPEYAHGLAENLAPLIAECAKNFSYVLLPANAFGKNLLPRVAGILGVSQVSDVIKIISSDTYLRPLYAGSVLSTVQSKEAIQLLTLRTTAYSPAASQATSAPIEALSTVTVAKNVAWVSQENTVSARPDLTTARIVIAGGRGVGSAANFILLEKIADKLGAAIGASRAAVDAGFAPNDWQIGQTGKVIAPDLYIAVGISGAIQHVAGIKDSKVIVAINQDPDASIFRVADYGLVGDLFTILPELEKLL
jgi:electron transfer flavoprotein alpha subunit